MLKPKAVEFRVNLWKIFHNLSDRNEIPKSGLNFLVNEKNIKDIKWNDSISLFKDLNSLHIVYYESRKKNKRGETKRIRLINKLNLRNTRRKKT